VLGAMQDIEVNMTWFLISRSSIPMEVAESYSNNSNRRQMEKKSIMGTINVLLIYGKEETLLKSFGGTSWIFSWSHIYITHYTQITLTSHMGRVGNYLQWLFLFWGNLTSSLTASPFF
jgi:hypothetical protein